MNETKSASVFFTKRFTMNRILFYFLVIAASSNLVTRALGCGPNEQWGNCGQICEGTCNNPDMSKCAVTECSGNGCQCKEGYLRNEETDLCIPAEECPPKQCKGTEIVAKCGRTCEGTCESPNTPEICSRINCATQDCQCDLDSGFVRDTNTGRCIALRDCPKTSSF